VVAEGIETPEQARELQRLQCDYGQGFLYSRPVPAHQIAALIAPDARPAR
jgi:EAL domain-containing protein (putative c-di-GMP-specific phosphodiesterase class I)